jgi:hypothetical protein
MRKGQGSADEVRRGNVTRRAAHNACPYSSRKCRAGSIMTKNALASLTCFSIALGLVDASSLSINIALSGPTTKTQPVERVFQPEPSATSGIGKGGKGGGVNPGKPNGAPDAGQGLTR